MCDTTNHKLYDSGLTDLNKVRKSIVSILDYIIVSFMDIFLPKILNSF